mmetsp:Transcript_56961/g.133771  ORF Transcript_56961/g.133771 Transcript_56961/m.133771 type:complete len:187 (-) Transcript_56961:33-593(-)
MHIVWGGIEQLDSDVSDEELLASSRYGSVLFLAESTDSEQTNAPSSSSETRRTKASGKPRHPAWSEGAGSHQLQQCRACVHFWKPHGCYKGASCEFCHLCSEEEGTLRRLERSNAKKLARRAEREKLANSMGKQPAGVAPKATASLGNMDGRAWFAQYMPQAKQAAHAANHSDHGAQAPPGFLRGM